MVVLTDLPAEGGGASLTQSHSSPVTAPAEDVIKYSETQVRPIKMEISTGVFDTRHPDNTEVLLALLTQNKELEGKTSIPIISYHILSYPIIHIILSNCSVIQGKIYFDLILCEREYI